jgi:hypothetical protein
MACGLLGQSGQHAMLAVAEENAREPEAAANLRTAVNSAKELARKLKNVLQRLTVQVWVGLG